MTLPYYGEEECFPILNTQSSIYPFVFPDGLKFPVSKTSPGPFEWSKPEITEPDMTENYLNNQSEKTLWLDQLPSGMYFIHVDDGQMHYSQKFVVHKE